MIKLINILKEGFNKDNYDLNSKFGKFNKLIFNNKLILDFPIKFIKTKLLAFVDATYNKSTGEIKIKSLNFSDLYKIPEDKFDLIFIHEMIHIKLAQENDNDYGDQHGIHFKQELNRIHKLGYNVPISEKLEDLNIELSNKMKSIYFILFKKPNNTYSIAFVKNISENEVIERYEYLNNSGYKIFFGKTENPTFIKYTKSNTIKNIKFYILPNIDADIIKSDITKQI